MPSIQNTPAVDSSGKKITWGDQWMPYIVMTIYLIGMFYGTMKLIS